MLLSYKPLHLEAQQRLQEEGCVVDITASAINLVDEENEQAPRPVEAEALPGNAMDDTVMRVIARVE